MEVVGARLENLAIIFTLFFIFTIKHRYIDSRPTPMGDAVDKTTARRGKLNLSKDSVKLNL